MHRCIAFRRRLQWQWKEGSPEPAVDEMRGASHRLDLKKWGDRDIGSSGHRDIGTTGRENSGRRRCAWPGMTRCPDLPMIRSSRVGISENRLPNAESVLLAKAVAYNRQFR